MIGHRALAAALAVGTGPLAAQAAEPSSGAILAETTLRGCYRIVSGETTLGTDLEQDNRVLEAAGLISGLQSETVDRIGRQGLAIIARSTIGQRSNGSDVIVVAVGGAIPGCRTILLSKDAESHGETAAAALTSAGWRHITPAKPSDGNVERWIFLKRDAAGTPYLINMFVNGVPSGDIRLITTVNLVPAGVILPKGI